MKRAGGETPLRLSGEAEFNLGGTAVAQIENEKKTFARKTPRQMHAQYILTTKGDF